MPKKTEVGWGIVKVDKEGVHYEGSLPVPIRDSERVCVMRVEELERFLRTEISFLTAHRVAMNEKFYTPYQGIRCADCPVLPDEVTIKTEEEEYKLFLDRAFYTHNPKKYMFVRWAGIDEAEEEP